MWKSPHECISGGFLFVLEAKDPVWNQNAKWFHFEF